MTVLSYRFNSEHNEDMAIETQIINLAVEVGKHMAVAVTNSGQMLFLYCMTSEQIQFGDDYSLHWSEPELPWQLRSGSQIYFFQLPDSIMKRWLSHATDELQIKKEAIHCKEQFLSNMVVYYKYNERPVIKMISIDENQLRLARERLQTMIFKSFEEEQMGYTFWIAVIGCVTGLISLAVEVARYLAERPHIQVRTYDELNNLIYIQEDVVKSYIHLQILNTGTRHILLQDAYLKHPGAKKNTLDNLTPFRQAYEQMPWKYYNGNLITALPDIVRLPCPAIPPGGVFECVLLFTDFFRECYDTEDHFLYPTLCVAFAPGIDRELEVQSILTSETDEFSYVDADGNQWSFNITP